MNLDANNNQTLIEFRSTFGCPNEVKVPKEATCEEVLSLIAEKLNIFRDELSIIVPIPANPGYWDPQKKYNALAFKLETAKETDLKVYKEFRRNIVSLIQDNHITLYVLRPAKPAKPIEEELIEDNRCRCNCIMQ